MARIPPDSNDILVWQLNENSGAYRNTGSISPNSSITDLTVVNNIYRDNTGIFEETNPYFASASTFPTGASATRNYAAGASTISPTAPVSISCWINLKSYQTDSGKNIVGKLFRDHATTNAWTAPFWAIQIGLLTTNSGGDLFFAFATSATAQTSITVIDFPIPLHQWCHIGMTHDGTVMKAYLNGCQLMTYTSTVQNLSKPVSSIVYQDSTYGLNNTTGTYVPGVDDIGNNGDEVRTSVAFPFPVTLYGQVFNSGFVGSNGQIEFGQNTAGFNFTLPNASFGILLCIFQKDQSTAPSPTFGVFTTTTGTVGSRTFIIEWRNQPFGGGSTLNYECKFFENSTTFEFLYSTSTASTTGCIGIQSSAGSVSTVFSNSTTIPAAGTRLIFSLTTTSTPGAWVIGATPPYLVTSSSNKEEANYTVADVRIASAARPLSYFQNIYKVGVLPISLSSAIQYYKLRAYDTSCVTPTYVVWVDTQVSLANAPVFPCSGPYSAPEVIDTWVQ